MRKFKEGYLVDGGRGGGKDIQNDVKEAIDSLARFIEMQQ